MSGVDIPALLVAIGGVAGVILGYIQWQKGRADSVRQAEAAHRLEERELAHRERQAEMDYLHRETDRARARVAVCEDEIDELRRERDQLQQALDGARRQLGDEAAEMELLRKIARQMIDGEAARTEHAMEDRERS